MGSNDLVCLEFKITGSYEHRITFIPVLFVLKDLAFRSSRMVLATPRTDNSLKMRVPESRSMCHSMRLRIDFIAACRRLHLLFLNPLRGLCMIVVFVASRVRFASV
eukprot:6210494-Pleurochrysis_carterae.AAC.2